MSARCSPMIGLQDVLKLCHARDVVWDSGVFAAAGQDDSYNGSICEGASPRGGRGQNLGKWCPKPCRDC